MRRTDPEGHNKRFFRSGERIFSLNGQWFFATREGECGPFTTREEVLGEVDRFIRERRELAHFQKVREQETRAAQEADHAWEILPIDDSPEPLVIGILALESDQ